MIIYIILAIIICLLGYSTFNLLKKNEKQEEIIIKQDKFITEVSEVIQYSSERLGEIDEQGTFKSDDEIGWFFDEILKINVMLGQFILENNNNNGEKENKKKKGT